MIILAIITAIIHAICTLRALHWVLQGKAIGGNLFAASLFGASLALSVNYIANH